MMRVSTEHPLALLLTTSLDAALSAHPSIIAVVGWIAGMLSYHQDVRYDLRSWGIVSQLFAIICLTALLVFVFTRGEWWNLLIVPPLIWLHVQFTKRWSARPGAWW
jgi:hypothetical protein